MSHEQQVMGHEQLEAARVAARGQSWGGGGLGAGRLQEVAAGRRREDSLSGFRGSLRGRGGGGWRLGGLPTRDGPVASGRETVR